ncbi:MAG: hypothetical protein WAU76_01740 [Candidatus Sulfotelmatobacter sp.]
MDTSDCQIADLVRSSKKYPRLLTRLYQLRCNLQAHGLLGTSRKMWSKFVRDEVATDPRRVARSIETCSASEVLGLQPGELVEIKSEEEIRRTLDVTGKNRGLGFMPEMWPYCGQQGRVLKRVEKICLEEASRTVRAMKNTVILEGLFCQGNGIGCDRACFYFWRECWLKRAPSSSIDPVHHAPADLVRIKREPQI